MILQNGGIKMKENANLTMREKIEAIEDYVEEIKSLVGEEYVPVLYYYSGNYEEEDLDYDINLLETIISEIMTVDEAIKNMTDLQLRRVEKILKESLHKKDRKFINDYLFRIITKEFFSDEQTEIEKVLKIDNLLFI